jgi:hypothetical protein
LTSQIKFNKIPSMTIEAVESRWFGAYKKRRTLQERDVVEIGQGEVNFWGTTGSPVLSYDRSYSLRVISDDIIELKTEYPGTEGNPLHDELRKMWQENPDVYTKNEINTRLQSTLERILPEDRSRKPWVPKRSIVWKASK